MIGDILNPTNSIHVFKNFYISIIISFLYKLGGLIRVVFNFKRCILSYNKQAYSQDISLKVTFQLNYRLKLKVNFSFKRNTNTARNNYIITGIERKKTKIM